MADPNRGKEGETPWNDEAVYDAALRSLVNYGWGYDLKVEVFDPKDPHLQTKLNDLVGSEGPEGAEIPLKIIARVDIGSSAILVWYYAETEGEEDEEEAGAC